MGAHTEAEPGLFPRLPRRAQVRDCCAPGTRLQWTGVSGSVPLALWAQCLRDTGANCLHARSGGGAEGRADNSVLCEPSQATPQSTLPGGQLWRSNCQRLLSRGSAPIPPSSHCSSESDRGASAPTTVADGAVTTIEQPSAGSGHHTTTCQAQTASTR